MEKPNQIITVTLNPSIDTLYKMDAFLLGKTNRSSAPIRTAGGKGLNVTRVIRQLGEEVTATGFLGGSAGRFIHLELERLGICDSFVEIEGETRTCLALVEAAGTQTEVLESGPRVMDHEIEQFKKCFSELVKNARLVTVSGSLPKGIIPTIYQYLLGVCSEHSVKLLLDTSGQTLLDCLDHKPFMIKPNLEELEQISGETFESDEAIWKAIDELQSKGIPLVIVSNGAKGAYASYYGRKILVSTPVIETVSAVGSGDSFVAGMAVGLVRNEPIEKILALASACGAANAMQETTGSIQLDQVQLLEKKVRCQDTLGTEACDGKPDVF